MAVLIVDAVTDSQDVVELITYLTQALAGGDTHTIFNHGTLTLTRGTVPTPAELDDLVRMDQDESCTDPYHRTGCSCVENAANTDPRQLVVVDAPRHLGPVPYVPCPRQGLHRSLTECWMCWSDVHRGAITAAQAIAVGVR